MNGNDINVFQVIKAKNFSDCDNNPRYHFGFALDKNYEPGTSRMGNLMTVSKLNIQ